MAAAAAASSSSSPPSAAALGADAKALGSKVAAAPKPPAAPKPKMGAAGVSSFFSSVCWETRGGHRASARAAGTRKRSRASRRDRGEKKSAAAARFWPTRGVADRTREGRRGCPGRDDAPAWSLPRRTSCVLLGLTSGCGPLRVQLCVGFPRSCRQQPASQVADTSGERRRLRSAAMFVSSGAHRTPIWRRG